MDSLYSEDNYKTSLKQRLKQLQKTRPSLTWRKVAAELPIQYTYLSKALNDPATHLSEDHLYAIARSFEFFPHEIEFLILQRSCETARDPERKTYLQHKIGERRQSQKLNATDQPVSSERLSDQIRYLFEPLAQVVHMALDVPRFREDPRRLCIPLSLSLDQLKEILRVLSRNEHIRLGEDGWTITEVNPAHIHFAPEHFLQRSSLNIIKAQILARIAQTPESDKSGFVATFTMDEPSFTKVREEFQGFLKRVEEIATKSKPKAVYQISFDLFKWL